jgi:transmembrane protein TMEM174 (potassium channel)
MSKGRLEAFSDGVITIMVLDLRSPAESDLAALAGILPGIGMYLLSFVFWASTGTTITTCSTPARGLVKTCGNHFPPSR